MDQTREQHPGRRAAPAPSPLAPGLRLRMTGDGTLELHLDHVVAPAALRLRRRDGQACVDLAPATTGDGVHARVDTASLAGPAPSRWDVLCVDAAGAESPLCPRPADSRERHFFKAVAGDHGLSAYLSDSLRSLVLFCAPREQHARTSAAEDAGAAFPRWLDELPLEQDLVLFESFLGKAYAGNPRYVYEALRELRPDLRCVWVYQGREPIPGDPPRVARGSAEYYRLLATARYRVNNVRFQAAGRKPETAYLQTWHGTPLKRLGYDIEVGGPEADARESFFRESRGWTALLSPNPFCTATLRRAFRYEGAVLEQGYPLTDPLLDPAPDRQALASELGLPPDRRYILYAPTWRDHRPVGHWRFDFDLHLDLQAVAAALAPDQVLLVRAHHLVAAGLDHASLPDNVIDVSHVDDATALCVLADVLVTDYSSILFDFAATGRPMLFYCYDLELYANQVRGFYLDVERDLPGPLARTTAELVALLHDLPGVQAAYAGRYARFREDFCALADGNAARRVVASFFGSAGPSARLVPADAGAEAA